MPRRRRRSRALHRSATFRLLLCGGALVAINVYVFFYSSGSLRQVARAAELASVRDRAPLVVPVGPRLATRTAAMKEREGLGAALRREGVSITDADGALRALRPLLDFKRDLRGTSKLALTMGEDGHLAALTLRAGGVTYAVHRSPDGKLLGGKSLAARR